MMEEYNVDMNVILYELQMWDVDSVNIGKYPFMYVIRVSAQAGHTMLQRSILHQSHAVGSPHHHYWHLLRLDHEMLVVLGESTKKKYIITLFLYR